MLAKKIVSVLENFRKDSSASIDLKILEEIRIKYLGRNGLVTNLFEELKSVSKEEKPALGKSLNSLRDQITSKITELKQNLTSLLEKEKSHIDLSLPGRHKQLGSNHLLTQTLNEIKSIFRSLGFSSIEGPELESDYYNFEALNFPKDHPARDMQDTFFISKDFLLRTHTTPVQVRIMEKHQPPVRAIMPGRVYRNEAVSSRSYCMFHQVDGIYVDTDVTFAELKGTLVAFAKQFYMEDLKYRFRPSFFPFTEPSAEMDITCYLCHGKGCKVCKYSGWLEILGCGMVDPNVFKMVGYDPEKYSGYAFGMGIERTAMLKYGITDIRIFFDNDFRFLKQF
ncbi:MAG: phenylalanine--tRNA ligase subunit alpha [Ignavibacteria bacterium RIFOXYB2_FULL_35_12]|nr:MAG: phenylalanine--tRNA ligase subunit alpha [Ignavibacteria bacterium GWA2_36_19]OGU60351.1 MAG: phenylalanine--tRNA ligase subunit alpha [Ignavibacteria bacterium GWF2_35_20]OGU81458.1 MAG: phenylalanine--tRNA ligase subunit alpha [Ignavibacteria bacterium RIFOXYA2_FULL_35_9]OGU90440.1 MAG: phenylalanine--tRNA ligase subunit alpha [Ignavibacteria bacterium RIFOXYA12_FULL_35_25]OGU94269.1 MAG: phenylalanine--tRNA ligase subunit alpha [Ignavibacteria bacterium RIFOXYB12_FULL_35_14]OGU98821